MYEYSYSGHYRVAVCYPNSYHVGMSNLGFLSLFHFLASIDGIKVDRYFIERDGKLFSPEVSILKTSSNRNRITGLAAFDALFFSVSFEMDYINIVKMLLLSGIDPISENRTKKNPIIITGGIVVTANPMPMSVISDIVYLGDMELGLKNLLELLFEHKFKRHDKFLNNASKIPGFYVRNVNSVVPDRAVKNDIETPAHSVIVSSNTVFANKFLIEVARGCKNSCRFCMTRTSNFPPRSIQKDSILEVAKRVKNYAGSVGLIAPVVNDNPDLIKVVNELNKIGYSVSFSSLRADRFTKELARLIRVNGQRTVTFAPETGSDSLRKKIGKFLKNEVILNSVELSIKNGIKNIRYYFMYGLPFERWEDIEAILNLTNETLKIVGNYGSLHLSINPFIPKKKTPFENEKIKNLSYYNNVKGYLLNNLKQIKKSKNLSIRFESLKFIHTHFFLSEGNEKTGYYLAKGGFSRSIGRIERDLKQLYYDGISPDEY